MDRGIDAAAGSSVAVRGHPSPSVSVSDSDMKEKYLRWMAAWSSLVPEGRSSLSSLQEVLIAHFAVPAEPVFSPGKIAVIPTTPFMLYWYMESNKRLKHHFNFVDAYSKGKVDKRTSGIFVGSNAKKLIGELRGGNLEGKKTVIMKLEGEELWLVFPNEQNVKVWKKAMSGLLKAFYLPVEPNSPLRTKVVETVMVPKRKTGVVMESMGLVFDISLTDKPDEIWANIKVTFLRSGSATHEEYFLFDKSQSVLEVSCEEILSCVRDKLDPANLAVLTVFLQERVMIEYERRKRLPGSEEIGWVFRDLKSPEASALWASDYKHIMQQYRQGDAFTLKQTLARRTSEVSKQLSSTPLQELFDLASLHCFGTKLMLTELAQVREDVLTKPVKKLAIEEPKVVVVEEPKPAPVEVQSAAPQKVFENFARPKASRGSAADGKWYKDACDCRLF